MNREQIRPTYVAIYHRGLYSVIHLTKLKLVALLPCTQIMMCHTTHMSAAYTAISRLFTIHT